LHVPDTHRPIGCAVHKQQSCCVNSCLHRVDGTAWISDTKERPLEIGTDQVSVLSSWTTFTV